MEFRFKVKDVDPLEPSVVLTRSLLDYDQFNYARIDHFNRFYFIKEVEVVSSRLVKVSLECDYLETYKDVVLNTEAQLQVPCLKGMFGDVEIETTGRILTTTAASDVELTPDNTLILTTIGGDPNG